MSHQQNAASVVPGPSRRTSLLLIVTAGLLAFVSWTIPVWNAFWSTFTQFPLLWQSPENRFPMLLLLLKMLSPLAVILFVRSALEIYRIILGAEREQQHEAPPVSSQRFQRAEARIERRQDDSARFILAQQQTHPLPVTHPSTAPSSSGTRQQMHLTIPDPVTPLPPVLSPSTTVLPDAEAHTHFPLKNASLQTLFIEQQEQDDVSSEADAQNDDADEKRRPANPTQSSTTHSLLAIRLLKEVGLTLCVPDGRRIEIPVQLQSKRVQLLAYVAWRRGDMIDREKVLEHVFGWGVPDEQATEEKLAEKFESHKKLLRKMIREVVVKQVNQPAKKELIDPDIDPFVYESGFWGLSGICRVEDLEAVEAAHNIIAIAAKEGDLAEEVPGTVKEACDRVIQAYTGDFLEELVKKYPGEFRSYQGRSSWARKPFTLYRDYYLEALWYAAVYETQQGQRASEGLLTEGGDVPPRTFQEYFTRAAELYQTYAMTACNSKFDTKVTFSIHGEYGERVGMSERALRRCIVLYGNIGRTDLVNKTWSTYLSQMKMISDQRWSPSPETLADVEAAKAQTSAYRFSTYLTTTLAQRQPPRPENASAS